MIDNVRVAVRPMSKNDLDLIEGWLREPQVARWWRDPPEGELAAMRPRVSGHLDDAIGDPAAVGHGVGRRVIATLRAWPDQEPDAEREGRSPPQSVHRQW